MDHARIEHIPPQNLEAEQAVLGSLLVDKACHPQVFADVRPEHFYKPAHADIFRAMSMAISRACS